jgi:hypothetical protein
LRDTVTEPLPALPLGRRHDFRQQRRGVEAGEADLVRKADFTAAMLVLTVAALALVLSQISIYPRQYLLQGRKELLPPALGAAGGSPCS